MNQTLFNKILEFYHLSESDYQALVAPVTRTNFYNNRHFDHAEEASALVRNVMANKGKIFIYGDYDADGIMGTSILTKMFMYEDYIVEYYIPNRYQDGYGLTLKKAQECIDNNVELVICVDNGVSAFEPIQLLKDHGVKVLVLDHHQPQETLPVADYILHPQISSFSEVASSGAFVAFMFSITFLGYFDKYLSTLAAISTISDMMPLKETNRNLLRLVFADYKEGEFLPIDLLKESDPFDETTIGMKIAPRINAVGRLIETPEINKMVEYFISDNQETILNYLKWINDNNEERKNASKEATEVLPNDLKGQAAIVYLTEAKEGLLGLIANHLCSTYHVPVIVFAQDHSGDMYKGSCRAPEGFNVVEAFNTLKDLLPSAGGHAAAGGCSVYKKDFEELKRRFVELAKNTPVVHVEKETIPMNITELNYDNYLTIKTFSPFGEGWPAPLFKLSRINTRSLFFSRTGEHILTQIGQNTRLTGFNFPRSEVSEYTYVDLSGSLKTSTYRGITSVEFIIKELKESAK